MEAAPAIPAADATAGAVVAPVAAAPPASTPAVDSSASSPASSLPPPAVPALAGYVLLPAVPPALPADLVSICDDALHDSILRVLGRVHPDRGVLPCALPAFARICNALAHLELLGAELNGGRVDTYVPVAIGALYEHNRSEVVKARTKFEAGDPTGGLEFKMSTADRWLREYREIHPDSTLQLDKPACIELLASVEYYMAEFLELCGNAARDNQQVCITVAHLFVVIENDEELLIFCNYLRQPFECSLQPWSDARRDHFDSYVTSIMQSLQSEQRDRRPQRLADKPRCFPRNTPILHVAAEEFADNEARMRTLNATCWYNNAARVAEYALAYARGELKPPVSEFFASFGIRPLAFFGHARRTRLGGPLADPRAFVAFELWDRDTQLWHPFLLSVRRSRQHPAFDVMSGAFWWPLARGQFDPRTNLETEMLQPQTIRTCKWEKWRLRELELPNLEVQGEADSSCSSNTGTQPQETAETSASGAVAHASTVAASAVAGSSSAVSSIAVSNDEYSTRRVRFREQMTAALLLSSFQRFGASLYSANHPLRARVAFTAAAVDVASTALGLPTLPTVLLDLIGEYDPMDLPYIPDSAASESTAAEAEALVALLEPVCDRGALPLGIDADLAPDSDRSHDAEDEDWHDRYASAEAE